MTSIMLTLMPVIFFPAIYIRASRSVRVVRWVSPIILCYVTGILMANLPFLRLNHSMLTNTTAVSVSLAIPLLLFSTGLGNLRKHAGKTVLSFALSVTGVLAASATAYLILSPITPEPWKVAGMMIGVYTGGTPNMSAIGIALSASEESFIILNSADIIISGLYFIFLLTVARPLLGTFLPVYKNGTNQDVGIAESNTSDLSGREIAIKTITGIAASVIILGAATGFSFLVSGKMNTPVIILVITTLGILCSFIRPLHRMETNYVTAEYLLMIFAVAMGSLANFRELVASSSVLFYYCGIVVVLSIIIHYALAAVFKIDADTVIITSTAAIYGPAFVGPVAEAIGNRQVIVAGITMGLFGYAIANYLGIAVAMLLK